MLSISLCFSGQKRRSKKTSPTEAPSTHSLSLETSPGVDYWLDVYCDVEKSYTPVHCMTGEVGGYEACERSATQPVHYVVAFGGEGRSAKDVTPKFSQTWLTVNRKLQLDTAWWTETLNLLPPLDMIRNVEEDAEIREMLSRRPIPASVHEFKVRSSLFIKSKIKNQKSKIGMVKK